MFCQDMKEPTSPPLETTESFSKISAHFTLEGYSLIRLVTEIIQNKHV